MYTGQPLHEHTGFTALDEWRRAVIVEWLATFWDGPTVRTVHCYAEC